MSDKMARHPGEDPALSSPQLALMTEFFRNGAPDAFALVGPPGSGKTYVGAKVVKCIVEQSESVRILVLVPYKVLLDQWRFRIEQLSSRLRPIVVDHRKYLELEAASGVGETPWPNGSIILMSVDLAKRRDVRMTLHQSEWDLLVVEVEQTISGVKNIVYQDLIKNGNVKRSLLLVDDSDASLFPGVERIHVNPENITDPREIRASSKPDIRIEDILFDRDTAEAESYAEIASFADEVSALESNNKVLADVVGRAADSSPLALDELLRRLIERWRPIRNRIAHAMTPVGAGAGDNKLAEELALDDFGFSGKTFNESFDSPVFLILYERVDDLLTLVEDLSVDSKASALQAHLNQMASEETKRHICVMTSFATTAEYLQTLLEETFVDVFLVTGSVEVEARLIQIEKFKAAGGLLITTDGALRGVELPFVDECIHYDLPTNEKALYVRWSRFVRPVRMFALKQNPKEREGD